MCIPEALTSASSQEKHGQSPVARALEDVARPRRGAVPEHQQRVDALDQLSVPQGAARTTQVPEPRDLDDPQAPASCAINSTSVDAARCA